MNMENKEKLAETVTGRQLVGCSTAYSFLAGFTADAFLSLMALFSWSDELDHIALVGYGTAKQFGWPTWKDVVENQMIDLGGAFLTPKDHELIINSWRVERVFAHTTMSGSGTNFKTLFLRRKKGPAAEGRALGV